MERARGGPGEEFVWSEGAEHGASFDGDSDRQSPSVDPAATHGVAESGVDAQTLGASGAASTKRIGADRGKRTLRGTPSGRGNPLRDPVVQAELHRAAADEKNVHFPYAATVTTKVDPLRLRASASLSATILTRMPKGAHVTVTGPSQNHFRPVTFVNPVHPGRTWKGYAFTSYLSPPKVDQAALSDDPVVMPTVIVTAVRPPVIAAEEEPVHMVPPAELLHEVTLPPVEAPPTIANTDQAIAGRVIEDMRRFNGDHPSLSTGLHYKDTYQRALEAAGRGAEWDRRWEQGHTASRLFIQPYEVGDPMTFRLREGSSASEGLRQWMAGLTVADCTVAMVAIELDAVRAVVGDVIFDRCFGSPKGPARVRQLVLSQRLSETPLYELLRFTDAARNTGKERGEPGKRPVKPGEWYYFSNVPDYVDKHPAGQWRGENALYIGEEGGKQMWSGLGSTHDEEGMLRELLARHNAPRDAADFSWLNRNFTLPENWGWRYVDGFAATRPAGDPVPNNGPRDQVDIDAIVAAQKQAPAAPEPRKKPAGLDLSTGMVLSTAKLAELARTYGDDHSADVDSTID